MNEKVVSRNLWIIAGVYFLFNVIQSYLTPLINDEAYYWVWSQHLDWGYFDHPPMVALWANLGFHIFQNELGARLLTIIFGSLGFVLLGKLLDIKNKNQLTLYVSLFFSMVLFQVFGFINTPDAPLLFFGILYFYILKKFLECQNLTHSLLLGVAMALLIYSKYHGILLIVFSLLPHALKLIKSKYFYLAVSTGLLCYVPHIWWQFNNEFISLQYHLVQRNVRNVFKWSYPGDYLLSLIWASSPLLIYFNLKAVFKTSYTTAFHKSLIWSLVGIIGFFILITFKRYIQAQWSLVAFIPLLIISYSYYKDNAKRINQIKIYAVITWVIIGMARVYFIVQDVPYPTQYHGWKSFMKQAGEHTKGIAVFERYQYASLFNFYNYPHKKAHTYITLENRTSQYNLLYNEDELEGKEITYFSKYIDAKDSINLRAREGFIPFYYEWIPIYRSSANVQMVVSQEKKHANGVTMQVEFMNMGDFAVNISQENNFSLVEVVPKEPYSNEILCFQHIPFEPMELKANESIVQSITVPECSSSVDDSLGYLGIIYKNLPPKKQSNYINLEPSQ